MKKFYFFYLVTMLLLTTGMLASFLILTEKKLNIERTSSYEKLIGDVVEISKRVIEERMTDTKISMSNFLKYDNSTFEKVTESFENNNNLFQKDYITTVLVSSNNYAYSSGEDFSFKGTKLKHESITFLSKNDIVYIALSIKMDDSLVVEGQAFDYYVHVIPFDYFRPYFGTLGIKDGCYISILGDNGVIDFEFNGNINSNFFSFIYEQIDYSRETANSLIYNIENHIESCSRVKIEETDCYIANKKIYDWDLVIICPVGFLYLEQLNYTPVIKLFFVTLSGVIFFSLLALCHILIKYNKDKKIYYYQKLVQNELEEAVDEANKANEAKSDFLSRISHDIRTPMNGIMGMTHIAKTNINNKEKVSYCLNKIEQASDHLLSLLNNVLDLSRIESGVIQLKYSPVNIKELLQTCESMLVSQSQSLSLNLETKYEIHHEFIMVDEVRLKQVLINILSNAVKFNVYGGNIKFTVKEERIDDTKSKIEFTVKDTGMGMSQEFLNNIFEPFVQENESDARTKYKGSGLGMSIVKELVDLMGGKIFINSKEGIGTEIIVILETEYLKDEKELEEKLGKYEKLQGMKILLVEDNEINMEIAKTLLNEVGVIVTEAANGQEAIDIFESSPVNYYHVILMDILMPVKDGYTAAKEIKKLNRPDSEDIPIIAMTANAYNEDKERVYESGMCAHVIKPIQIEKLYDTLLRFRK